MGASALRHEIEELVAAGHWHAELAQCRGAGAGRQALGSLGFGAASQLGAGAGGQVRNPVRAGRDGGHEKPGPDRRFAGK